jgi:hypothetical protein
MSITKTEAVEVLRHALCNDERLWAALLVVLRADAAQPSTPKGGAVAEVAAWHRRMQRELSGKGSAWASAEMYRCQHGKFADALERLTAPADAAAPGVGEVGWLLDSTAWQVHPDSMSHDEAGSLWVWAQDAAAALRRLATPAPAATVAQVEAAAKSMAAVDAANARFEVTTEDEAWESLAVVGKGYWRGLARAALAAASKGVGS